VDSGPFLACTAYDVYSFQNIEEVFALMRVSELRIIRANGGPIARYFRRFDVRLVSSAILSVEEQVTGAEPHPAVLMTRYWYLARQHYRLPVVTSTQDTQRVHCNV
jgi:hypothetical protein